MDRLLRLSARALGVLEGATWFPPLFARAVVGTVFASSGWGKLHNLEQVTAFFADLGIPFPGLQAPFVAGTELVCGALLLVGLATRLAAVPLVATMGVALATALAEQITGAVALFGLSEFLYIVLLVGLVVNGPGAVALDTLLARAFATERLPLLTRSLGSHAAPE
jgi:putative oxidoreductase